MNPIINETSFETCVILKPAAKTNSLSPIPPKLIGNAMIIVIAGFPSAFISILFTGSLLIEVIFSLDGLGLLGFEAAINRDYPVMFSTLYIFTLLGLVLAIARDIAYVFVDPRIDFESR